jgi:alkylation response protein AidB-like acyl-CoA dehydrogenase
MDFDFKEEHEIVRKSVREFARKEIAPLVEEADLKEEFPKELFPKMGELGYIGVTFPEKYGGPGGDTISECIILEEIAFISLGISSPLHVQTVTLRFILLDGTEKQKERYLHPGLKGKEIWAGGNTEPDAGSDKTMTRTTFQKKGDHFILNGAKIFSTNSPIADHFVIQGYTDQTKGLKGLSRFILDKGTPGLEISKMSKFGLRSAEMGELYFQDCIIPKENHLSEGGRFFARERRPATWIAFTAQNIGVARAAFEASLMHAKTRVQFGRPIGLFQANSFKLAEMAVELDTASLLTYRVAWLLDQGRDCFKEASMAKLFAQEMAVRITGHALQIHGAQGCMMDSNIQRYFRDARVRTIPESSSEILHILISRELGLKADDYHGYGDFR